MAMVMTAITATEATITSPVMVAMVATIASPVMVATVATAMLHTGELNYCSKSEANDDGMGCAFILCSIVKMYYKLMFLLP